MDFVSIGIIIIIIVSALLNGGECSARHCKSTHRTGGDSRGTRQMAHIEYVAPTNVSLSLPFALFLSCPRTDGV